MIRRLRNDPGRSTNFEAAHVAVSRGMADVLTALDNLIDDDAALGRVCAELGKNLPGAASGWATGTVVNECAQVGTPGSALTTTRESGPAASRRPLAVRCVAAAAAAALAAGGTGALPAIGAPGAGHDGTDGPAERASYVVKRVSSSLRAAERSPVRVVIRAAPAKPGFLTADINWLPLTAQNLAKLTVPIPTGFRHVPLAEAVTPVLHHAAG